MKPIHISEINLKSGGPLDNHFQIKCRGFNLIYGLNESGKTYVVEALIKWLFSKGDAGSFRCRAGLEHAGWVKVLGIEPNPDKPKKFQRTGGNKQRLGPLMGQEVSLVKLLVVRAGQSQISEDSSGAGDEVLRDQLSELGFLQKIKSRVGYADSGMATLEMVITERGNIIDGNGRIVNPWKDQKNRRDDLLEKKKENDDYTEYGINQSKQRILELEKYKKYLAGDISSRIKKIEAELVNLPADAVLNDFRDNVRDLDAEVLKKQALEKDLKEIEPRADLADWTADARDRWEQLDQGGVGEHTNVPVIVSVVALSAVVIFGLLGPKWCFVVSVVGLAVGMVWWFIKYRMETSSISPEQKEEREGIQKEYNVNFPAAKFIGAVSLRVPNPDPRIERTKLQGDKEGSEKNIEQRKNTIIKSFSGYQMDEDAACSASLDWSDQFLDTANCEFTSECFDIIEQKRRKRVSLNGETVALQGRLANLDVKEEDYLSKSPGEEWSWQEIENLKDELVKDKENLERELADNPVGWEDRIKEQEKEFCEVLEEYKDHTATLLAKICVWDCVRKREDEEWETISDNLDDQQLAGELASMTGGHISQFSLSEDESGIRKLLVQNSESEEFPLEDVSTGVQEQSLLALRVGFARRKLGDRAAFLILDDAFQRADYERRPEMIRHTLQLVQEHGWQVFYFTMDDNIRDTFRSEANNIFGEDEYLYHSLSNGFAQKDSEDRSHQLQ